MTREASCPLAAARSKVIVRRSEAEKMTPGGIHLPDGAKEKPVSGIILDIGLERLLESGTTVPFHGRVGQTVYFNRYGGHEVEVGEEKYLVIDQDQILAFKKE